MRLGKLQPVIGFLLPFLVLSAVAVYGFRTSGSRGGAPEDSAAARCDATAPARCYFVAPDGDDRHKGSFESPFKTFRAAIVRARSGDVIYARGGSYGIANAMVSGSIALPESHPATSCPGAQILRDEHCFRDKVVMIALRDFDSWASRAKPYTVRSGTEKQPITIRNYPGEHPVLDVRGISSVAIDIREKSHWIVSGFEMIGGMISISGGSEEAQTHDILIEDNDIHSLVTSADGNPGLIRIDRGDVGGPYNIFIENNRIHNIYDRDKPGQWSGIPDAQHFGAITMLSREVYGGVDGGGTGFIRIYNNEIFECPQAFYLKNPARGPIHILANRIRAVERIGIMGASNVHMVGNLIHGVSTGWWAVGFEEADSRLQHIAGQSAVIRYNTFVDLDSLLGIRSGTGHEISHNVFAGLTGRTEGAGWETPAYISKSLPFRDSLEPRDSILRKIHSDNNCFVTPFEDFQFVSRYLAPPDDELRVEHWDHAAGSRLFGFDRDSLLVVSSEPRSVFVDPAGGDYRLRDPAMCAGMGYYHRDKGLKAYLRDRDLH